MRQGGPQGQHLLVTLASVSSVLMITLPSGIAVLRDIFRFYDQLESTTISPGINIFEYLLSKAYIYMHIYAHIDEPRFLWDAFLKIGTTWVEEYAYV